MLRCDTCSATELSRYRRQHEAQPSETYPSDRPVSFGSFHDYLTTGTATLPALVALFDILLGVSVRYWVQLPSSFKMTTAADPHLTCRSELLLPLILPEFGTWCGSINKMIQLKRHLCPSIGWWVLLNPEGKWEKTAQSWTLKAASFQGHYCSTSRNLRGRWWEMDM